MHLAGELAGIAGEDDAAASGELAGLEAAHALGLGDVASREREAVLRERISGAGAGEVAVPPPVSGAGRGKCFACLCEDVTAKDLGLAAAEGYDSIELSKRYTTCLLYTSDAADE